MLDIREALGSVRPSSVIKAAVYSLFCVVLVCTVSSALPSFGYRGASPDLILCATVALAYYEGERAACVFGMLSGFVLESVGSTGLSLLPLFYMLVGCVCALLFLKILGKNIGAYLLYVCVFMLVRSAISLIYIQFSDPDYIMSLAFTEVLVPEYLASVAASPIIFFICGFIYRRLNSRGSIQEGKLQ